MSRERRAVFASVGLVAAVAVWVYWPALNNLFLHWDDLVYLKRAMVDRTFTLDRIRVVFTTTYFLNYHPLTTLSHALDCRLWGMNPAPHHAVNVLLHAVNVGLLTMLLWELLAATRAFNAHEQLAVTVGVALAFAVHPLQVETVAWIAERKALLCATFSLGCLYAYVKRARTTTLVLFALAVLSKPTAAPLPAVMLLLDVYPLRRSAGVGWRRLVGEKLPLFAMSAIISSVAVWAQAAGHATTTLERLGVAARCLVASRGAVFYIWKLLWPVGLSPYYPLEGMITLRDREFSLSVASCVIVTVVAIWRRRKWPALVASWFAYLALIAPTSGLVQMGGQAVADRYAYLAIVPVLLPIAWTIVWAWRRFTIVGQWVLLAAVACTFAFWGFKTRAEIGVWHDDETLWRAALAYFPRSVRVNGNVAMALARQGRMDAAEPFADFAVRANPEDPLYRTTRGLIYLTRHSYDEALADFEVAVRSDPDMAVAHYDLACVYSRLGRTSEALAALREAVSRDAGFRRLAQRDEDLANLRNDPRLAASVRELFGKEP
ncbi:MAG TPA: tetratricopeptide repeat protein [Verrucomicrobiae bacterium]|nr:tetratricopeptide repeat protein [Verrucomicrobiae bacterium]